MFKLCALNLSNDFIVSLFSCSHRGFYKLGCHNVVFITTFNNSIFILGSYANSKVCGEGPSSCGPNYKVGFSGVYAETGKNALVLFYGELNIDGLAGILCILDFCFS